LLRLEARRRNIATRNFVAEARCCHQERLIGAFALLRRSGRQRGSCHAKSLSGRRCPAFVPSVDGIGGRLWRRRGCRSSARCPLAPNWQILAPPGAPGGPGGFNRPDLLPGRCSGSGPAGSGPPSNLRPLIHSTLGSPIGFGAGVPGFCRFSEDWGARWGC
jgi:hypothetical protein